MSANRITTGLYGSFERYQSRRLPNMPAVPSRCPRRAITASALAAVKHQPLAFDLSNLGFVVVDLRSVVMLITDLARLSYAD